MNKKNELGYKKRYISLDKLNDILTNDNHFLDTVMTNLYELGSCMTLMAIHYKAMKYNFSETKPCQDVNGSRWWRAYARFFKTSNKRKLHING